MQNGDLTPPQRRALQRVAKIMLDYLEASEHRVILIPAPDPQHSVHSVRIVESQNAKWYREFASQYCNARGRGPKRMKRARTFIVRRDIEAALRRMIAGDFRGTHADRLIQFIERKRSNRHFARRPIDDEGISEFGEFRF